VEAIRAAIRAHWRKVFNFAFRMTLDRDRAKDLVEETYLRAYVGADKMPPGDQVDRWLPKIADHVAEMLDETLRSEATRTDVVSSLTNPQRNFLLWELKQGCMTSVANCLPPGERAAFVMSVILGHSEEDGAMTLGITLSAYKVRLSRARKKVADYLAPRCEHVDPRNPCRCPSRVGVALDKGFLGPPPSAIVNIRPAFGRYGSTVDGEDAPLRDVMAIYRSLPEPDAPDDLGQHLLSLLESGRWDRYKDKSKGGAGR
jgi:RNA polymerase sigma factor (sigma-70 family)